MAGFLGVLSSILGVIKSVFGGAMRDVFFARIPQQFLPGQIYASAAAIGSVIYAILWSQGYGGAIGFISCIVITFMIRMVTVKYNITSL